MTNNAVAFQHAQRNNEAHSFVVTNYVLFELALSLSLQLFMGQMPFVLKS